MPPHVSDWNKIEEANKIRDELCDKSWDELKNNSQIFEKVFSEEFETTPAEMLMMDRNYFLEQIFINPELISSGLKSDVIKFYALYDFAQDPAQIQKDYWDIAEGLNFQPNIDLAKTQTEAKRITNGLDNLAKFSYYQDAQDIIVQLTAIKSFSNDQIQAIYTELSRLLEVLQQAITAKREVNINEINQVIQIEKRFGHLDVELEEIKEETDPIVFIDLLTENRKALTILEIADKEGSREYLNDVNFIADLIESHDLE